MRAALALAPLVLLPLAASAEPAPRATCTLSVIHASGKDGPTAPALAAFIPRFRDAKYRKWKAFQLVNQARYTLGPGGKAVFSSGKEALALVYTGHDGTRHALLGTVQPGKRRPIPFSVADVDGVTLVDGGPLPEGALVYGVQCGVLAP